MWMDSCGCGSCGWDHSKNSTPKLAEFWRLISAAAQLHNSCLSAAAQQLYQLHNGTKLISAAATIAARPLALKIRHCFFTSTRDPYTCRPKAQSSWIHEKGLTFNPDTAVRFAARRPSPCQIPSFLLLDSGGKLRPVTEALVYRGLLQADQSFSGEERACDRRRIVERPRRH